MAAQVVYVAAKLGLADLITEEPKTAHELAHATKTHGPSLGRFLRALVGLGIFTEDEKGRFHHTPLSETLRSEPVKGLGSDAGSPIYLEALGRVVRSCRYRPTRVRAHIWLQSIRPFGRAPR